MRIVEHALDRLRVGGYGCFQNFFSKRYRSYTLTRKEECVEWLVRECPNSLVEGAMNNSQAALISEPMLQLLSKKLHGFWKTWYRDLAIGFFRHTEDHEMHFRSCKPCQCAWGEIQKHISELPPIKE